MGTGLTLLPALAILVGAGILSACSSSEPRAPGSDPNTSATSTPAFDPDPSTSTAASDPDSSATSSSTPDEQAYAEAVGFARAEVHERFGHPLEDIELVSAEPVQWRDSSLGCPRNGRSYEPGPVAGYRVVLAWGDVRFDYHGADGQRPFHCMFLDG